MDITIKDLTEEQVETVREFAHAVKSQLIKDIEVLNHHNCLFANKTNWQFDCRDSYRVKPQPSYLDLHKASGLKVGDKVKITTDWTEEKNGYKFTRPEQRDRSYLGYVGEITFDANLYGFWVDGEYLLPYYALEKIEEEWIVKYKGKGWKSYRYTIHNKIFKSKEEAQKMFGQDPNMYVEYIKIK